MAKLVLLSTGFTGRTQDLKLEKTTIGRVEDNTFQIAEPSVSSHHCEVIVKGEEVLVRDLNSTNGTFINGEKVTEKVLKPGQLLRLGQIEMRLETDTPTAGPMKKPIDQTMVMKPQRGVSLTDLEQGTRAGGFDSKGTGFSKKNNKANKIILIGGIVLGTVIALLLAYFLYEFSK
jgi:predicted component of type VI protein secretion system